MTVVADAIRIALALIGHKDQVGRCLDEAGRADELTGATVDELRHDRRHQSP